MTILYTADGRPATIRRDREAISKATTELLAAFQAETPGGLRKQIRKRNKAAKDAHRRARLQALIDTPAPAVPRPAREQGVYVIGSAGGSIKIGIASDVSKRLHGLQTGCPDKLKLYYWTDLLPAGAAREIEKACHARLSSQRITGEWFDLQWRDAVSLVRSMASGFGNE